MRSLLPGSHLVVPQAIGRAPLLDFVGEQRVHGRMNEQTLASLADLYLLRCDVEGKSPRTVQAYRETVARFLRVLPERVVRPEQVQADHIYVYLVAYTKHSLETRHRYFREVRCFFNWLVELDYLERSLFRGLKNVRLPQRIVAPFSREEIEALLHSCDGGAMGMRDRALLLMLLDTGARCSEIAQLRLDDLDLTDRRLRILHGKGNKQRVVPFADRCAAALGQYLEARGDEPGPLYERSQRRPDLAVHDRRFWSTLARGWSEWRGAVSLVQPDTVVRWHRTARRRYRTWKSRPRRPWRPRVTSEACELIRRMARENRTWGSVRIVGELRASRVLKKRR